MLTCFRVPLDFDPAPIQSEIDQIADSAWTPHFNTGYFSGDWSGIALRSKAGSESELYEDFHTNGDPIDTPILGRLPHVSKVLQTIHCNLLSARLLKLGPASVIREHRDYTLGYEYGVLRMHFPIRTNPQVEFLIDGDEVKMSEGECWYVDLSLPHRVKNDGQENRIHLVVDCEINEWLMSLLPPEVSQPQINPEPTQSSPAEFARFHEAVLQDANLLARLRQVDDMESFARLAVRVGETAGYQFAAQDVQEAIMSARRAWTERWIA